MPDEVPLAIVLFLKSISHVQRVAFSDTSPVGNSLIMGLSIRPVCADSTALASYKQRPQHWGAEAVFGEVANVPGTPGTIP